RAKILWCGLAAPPPEEAPLRRPVRDLPGAIAALPRPTREMEGWRREREAERRSSQERRIHRRYFRALAACQLAGVAAIASPQPRQRKLKTRRAGKVTTRNQ